MNIKTLKTPTNKLVETYNNKFNKSERYFIADQAIINLFEKFPENKKLEDILLKTTVINDLYSTNIYATFLMATHIQNLQIDDSLMAGNPTIVNKIAMGSGIGKSKNKKGINFYSFATKYCNWHNKEAYPIYDGFVGKILLAYRRKDKFSKFKNADLRIYARFKQIVTDFQNRYSLTGHNLKEIDKFLWFYGKETFPPKNKTKEVDLDSY